ncbi:hypothetical protein [Halodesulfurarchaeum sp.]
MTKKAAHGIRSTEGASETSVFRWFESRRAREPTSEVSRVNGSRVFQRTK